MMVMSKAEQVTKLFQEQKHSFLGRCRHAGCVSVNGVLGLTEEAAGPWLIGVSTQVGCK